MKSNQYVVIVTVSTISRPK